MMVGKTQMEMRMMRTKIWKTDADILLPSQHSSVSMIVMVQGHSPEFGSEKWFIF